MSMHCQNALSKAPHQESLVPGAPLFATCGSKTYQLLFERIELPSQTLLRMAGEAGKQIAKAGRKIVFVKGD